MPLLSYGLPLAEYAENAGMKKMTGALRRKERSMISSAFLLLMDSLWLFLRISPGDSFPRPLSKKEEEAVLAAWEAGDLEARNTLVEHNLRLVAHIVKKYYAQNEEVDDLISIGTVGLIKGVNTYRRDKGVKLASYVSRCIENEILMNFRSGKKLAEQMSLSEALDADGEEDGGLSILDVLAAEDDLTERVGTADLCRRLRECVDTALDGREREIIRLRYGLGGGRPLTQRETAERFSISRSYVSRIEKKALGKLRAALGEDWR